MLDVKFTDFTSTELNWLYCTLEEKRKDFESKINEIETFLPHGETRNDLHSFFTGQLDTCSQFMTKVDEAQRLVKAREIMTTQN